MLTRAICALSAAARPNQYARVDASGERNMLSSEKPVVSPRASAGAGPAARLTAKAVAASRATAIPKQARAPLPSMGFVKSRAASSRAGLLRSPPQAQRDQPQRSD